MFRPQGYHRRTMRLSAETARIIHDTAAEIFGQPVRLFGSRVDNNARGGDIDLYIEATLSSEEAERRRLRMLARLARQLGERRIDLVVKTAGPALPIHEVALRDGVVL